MVKNLTKFLSNNIYIEEEIIQIFKIDNIKPKIQTILESVFSKTFAKNNFLKHKIGKYTMQDYFGLDAFKNAIDKDFDSLTLSDVCFNPLFGISLMEYGSNLVYESINPLFTCTSHWHLFHPTNIKSSIPSEKLNYLNSLHASQNDIVSIHKLSILLFSLKLYYHIFIEPDIECEYHEKMIIFVRIMYNFCRIKDTIEDIPINVLMQPFQSQVINEINLRNTNNICENSRTLETVLQETLSLNKDVLIVDYLISENNILEDELNKTSTNIASPFYLIAHKQSSSFKYTPISDNEDNFANIFQRFTDKLNELTPNRCSILKDQKLNNFLNVENDSFISNKIPFLQNCTHFDLIVANTEKIETEHVNSNIATGLGYLNIFGIDDQSFL